MSRKVLFSVVLLLAPAWGAIAAAQNDRGTAEATVNSKTVRIEYGRPNLFGRDVLGLASVGSVWRLGADQATEIESSGDLVVAGKQLKAGRYSLWARKTGDRQWMLAFHPTTGIWGQPELREGYAAEMPLTLETAPRSADQLTISLTPQGNEAAVAIHWGTARLRGTFGVR